MTRRAEPCIAGMVLLVAVAAHAAEPPTARGPVMRTVATPSGPMLILETPGPAGPANGASLAPQSAAPAAVASASAPPMMDVQATAAGPMLVRRDPSAGVSAKARSLAASPAATARWPANARAEALPNGVQMLVVPTSEPRSVLPEQRRVVDVDPGKPGTRPIDTPRDDVLYRLPAAPTPAAKP